MLHILWVYSAELKSLPIQHTDAGAAFFLRKQYFCPAAAALIQAHHKGYLDFDKEQKKGAHIFRDTELLKSGTMSIHEYVDKTLDELIAVHLSEISENVTACNKNPRRRAAAYFCSPGELHCGFNTLCYAPKGRGIKPYGTNKDIKGNTSVFFRMALSCLADADHSDTALHYGEYPKIENTIALQPEKRLEKLDKYTALLGTKNDERSVLRTEMYRACRNNETGKNIVSCDSPVGSGKTTAIMAHLLHTALQKKLRRIIVVLPFTNIIVQSVQIYREALCLEGENQNEVVAELHHRADFQSVESRHLTALWRAPIIVTTAVAFFETLASNKPSALRRLHELPGSAIFIDEAHAALPVKLLPLAWRWINIYASEWNCYWVLASGSLNRFWNIEEINGGESFDVPELVDDTLRKKLARYEKHRIVYKYDFLPKDKTKLASWITSFAGPRLVIMNTVQSAAVLADYFEKQYGRDKIEHLSTALTPIDRSNTINRVRERLKNKADTDWTFIATSCVEAGVNLSFRSGFRELGSLTSLLQASGRVNREGEYGNSEVWTFTIAEDSMMKIHPMMRDSAAVLKKYFEDNKTITPELSTQSIQYEIRRQGVDSVFHKLIRYEEINWYEKVEENFKVINTNKEMAIVDEELVKRIEHHKKVDWQELQKKSVQILEYKLKMYHSEEILPDIYKWNLSYNSFLGYMAGILTVENFSSGEICVI
ncbi:MAG: hypothetical protein Ta2G_18730 [Termitinemataceae bacterium]|nr:MAG: hypothetical protein Ta2G_18730 [Termitinemataceae bacterium]